MQRSICHVHTDNNIEQWHEQKNLKQNERLWIYQRSFWKLLRRETGEGITKTITTGLEKIVHARGYKRLLALEGKIDLELNIDELREDHDFEW